MSPKVKAEQLVKVVPDRIREIAKERNVTLTDIAVNCLYVTARHFRRQLSIGEIEYSWLEKICEKLNISRDYLLGNTDKKKERVEDFYAMDKMKESLVQLLRFSQNRHYTAKVEQLSGTDIEHILDLLIAMIDSPEKVDAIMPYEALEKIHYETVTAWKFATKAGEE